MQKKEEEERQRMLGVQEWTKKNGEKVEKDLVSKAARGKRERQKEKLLSEDVSLSSQEKHVELN